LLLDDQVKETNELFKKSNNILKQENNDIKVSYKMLQNELNSLKQLINSPIIEEKQKNKSTNPSFRKEHKNNYVSKSFSKILIIDEYESNKLKPRLRHFKKDPNSKFLGTYLICKYYKRTFTFT